MKKSSSITALLTRAEKDFDILTKEYQESLHEQTVKEDLKISIKNVFENLKSCLDYIARDLFLIFCAPAKQNNNLYFPIRQGKEDFNATINKDFPFLKERSPKAWEILESVQPYNKPWLGLFNSLNNHNKHQELVEQTRTEFKRTEAKSSQGAVSWSSGVTFSPGVSILGVPIDPATQMPIPNGSVTAKVIVYVGFRFSENNEDVLDFIKKSIEGVKSIFNDLSDEI
ncbi:hypothetical protein CXB40_21765 [Pseudomonas syringae pv. avii]|uniref:hypothetical protein n=1 Tax=Pseudomonas syringae TaxID=317 RepID=UPI000CDA8152|nr:hypothetical protein [Pseudomonas syringae]POQ04260.1 hypothetical protein CXB40_21765 [Pseudomonas syringae pv. avii]